MSEWTIEIAQLPIVASAGSHTFWILKDLSGNTILEIHGFATGADGTADGLISRAEFECDKSDRLWFFRNDNSCLSVFSRIGGHFAQTHSQ